MPSRKQPPTPQPPPFRRRPTHIREWRKYRGLTLEQLGAIIEMSASNLSLIERGDYPYSQDNLERIASALNCEPADLLLRNPNDPEEMLLLWGRLSDDRRRQAVRLLRALAEDGD